MAEDIIARSKDVLEKFRNQQRRRRADLGKDFLYQELQRLRDNPELKPIANILEYLVERALQQANLESLERRALTKLIDVLETEG